MAVSAKFRKFNDIGAMVSRRVPDLKPDQQSIVDLEQKQAWLSVLLV
jgi:hypothetical protein